MSGLHNPGVSACALNLTFINRISYMTNNNTELLIRLAQGGKKNAIDMLWETYGAEVLDLAASQSSYRQSDFSLRGLSRAERRRAIMGETFLLFRRLVMKFDPSRNDDFLGYVVQYLVWQAQSEKRKNAKLSGREVLGDEALNWCVGDSGLEGDQEGLRNLVAQVSDTLESRPELQKCLDEFYSVCEYAEKGEVVEVAQRVNCTRMTVYNQVRAIRKTLQNGANSHLVEEIKHVLAA